MDPFAVAQKTYPSPNGLLSYESQLISAVVTSRAPVIGHPEYEHIGDWSKILGKVEEKKSDNGKGKYYIAAWKKEDEDGLGVIVRLRLRGEEKPRELTIMMSQAYPRFSTQWATDPQQQICYLAIRKWARRYTPEAILGIYDRDEMEQRDEREINPIERPVRASISEMASVSGPVQQATPAVITPSNEGAKQEVAVQDAAPSNAETLAGKIRDQITAADTVEKATQIRADFDSAKTTLGSTLFTELKGKAVARYHHIDARNAVEAALNSLDPSQPGAKELFAKAEQLIKARKKHLGDELYDGYMVTVNDWRPEFQ
jgi:hypothetical protein